jgi:transposase-like protein
MFEITEVAKDLIRRGQLNNDLELIKMGNDLLSQNSPKIDNKKVYKCTECGHTMDYDRAGRKKCLKCKKNTLEITSPENKVEEPKNPFEFQVRNKDKSRIRYDENGQPVGKYTKSVTVEGVTNVWNDNTEEGFDEENERLKQITKVSARTRQPTKLVDITCSECKVSYKVHPIHVSGRSKFICDKCIKRRSRI